MDKFTRQYIITALWAETDGDDPLDDNYTIEDLAPQTVRACVRDCMAFQKEYGHLYDDPETAGHDFWLTRNGHGAGFWDGDYPEPQATQLTEASEKYGAIDIYPGDDGLIYILGEE